MKLYDYFRSSAAYRVRIALNLKGLSCNTVPVNLLEGEQYATPYGQRNPQHLVPAIETAAGILTQSLAIIEYLDDIHPQRRLLPEDPWQRAQQRSMALVIACDVHPLNNLRVLKYLSGPLQQPEEAVQNWIAAWITAGFKSLERKAGAAPFLGGEQPMLADVLLVPQVFNARRYKVPLDAFPRLVSIDDRCKALPAFAQAAPDVAEVR